MSIYTQRTLRSQERRYWLWKSTDGKCAICSEELGEDWHADHIEPWKITKRTNVFEMQALCPKCNLMKGDKVNPMCSEETTLRDQMVFNWDACRRGTKEVITVAIERFTSGEKFQANNLPTRYGKSPTGRLLGGIAARGWITPQGTSVEPFACTNLWMTHTATLRHQFVSSKKWAEFKRIFDLHTDLIYSEIKTIPKNYVLGIRPNNEDFLACTIQLVISNQKLFCDWIDHELNKTGLPPNIHFDECHFASSVKPWGDLLIALEQAGANIVLWTATARRADSSLIPFFISEPLDMREYNRWDIVDQIEMDGTLFWQMDKKSVKQETYRLKGHVNVPFSEAWAEGYLCRISHQTFDVDLTKIDGEDTSEGHELKDLSKSYVRSSGVLGRILRDPIVIQPACEQALKYLKQHRKANHKAGMIVFSEADTTGIANRHAKAIMKEFKKLDSSLKVDIATTKSADAPDKLLEEFVENDHDIVIVKDMAGAGWDCPRVKVVFDLSSTRQDASTIQRWTRGATPDGISEMMTLLTSHDALSDDISKRWITEEGGKASHTIEEFIETKLKEVKKEEKPFFIPNDVSVGSFSDHEGVTASSDREAIVDELFGFMPYAANYDTRASLSKKLEEVNITIVPKVPVSTISIDKKIKALQDSIIEIVDEVFLQEYWRQFTTYNEILYGRYKQQCYKKLLIRAGIPYENKSIRKNRDLEQLTALKIEAERWREELKYVTVNSSPS